MSPRRELALVVLACAAGAVLALVVAGRPWELAVTPRPAPLPDLRTARTGADLQPWLPALAWVGLAGAGALLATRGAARAAVGGLLVLAGAWLAVASAGAVVAAGAAAGADRPTGWRVLAGLAGLVVAAAGAATLRRGRRWPAMGARYERGGRPAAPPRSRARSPAAGPRDRPEDRPEALWDALDRGEDPTAR